MYMELLDDKQLNKWAKDMNRHFTKERLALRST